MILNIILTFINAAIMVLILTRDKKAGPMGPPGIPGPQGPKGETSVSDLPKWEYYKDGLRFYNKDNDVVVEYDKPLKK